MVLFETQSVMIAMGPEGRLFNTYPGPDGTAVIEYKTGIGGREE
jgi:hypothetical protein